MMAIVDNAFREWIADFKATNPGVSDSRAILDTAQYAFAAGRKAQREIDAARQPVGEPVTVEAVATVRRNGDGDRYIDWLTEGGIADLEAGDVLMVSDRAITDEDGSGEVYTAPPAQGVDLDGLRRAACVVNVVGQIDGHDVVRRDSVLDVIDTRRQRLTESQAVGK